MKRLLIAAIALCLAAPAAARQQGGWIGVWGAPPAPPTAQSRSFENQTVRQVLHLSRSGPRVRVRFTNAYGEAPLKIGAASLAIVGAGGEAVPRPLTFGGQAQVIIPAGAPMYSDPIDLPQRPDGLTDVAVRVYFPEATGPCTCHPQATATAQVFTGDATAGGGGEPVATFVNRAFISGVDAGGYPGGRTIVTFGDSITDGTRSTNDLNSRWPDILAARLRMSEPGVATGVVNAAISGNQVLATGRPVFGEAALARFDRDVLSVPGVTHLVILEGINDLGMNNGDARPSAEQIVAGYRQLIARARAHGIKVIGATLLPYEGAAYFSEEGETRRQAVNRWIRTGGEYDGVIDFEAVVRDPENPRRIRADWQSGDWLHPNDAGYRAMAEAVDLGLFR